MSTITASVAPAGIDEPTRPARWGVWAGIAFIVLMVASYSVAPTPPKFDATADQIRAFFVTNAPGVRVLALLQSFAAAALLLFGCWLADAIAQDDRARPWSRVVVAATAMIVALSLASVAVTATLAFGVASSAEPGVLRALFDLGNLVLDVGDPMVALLVAAVTANLRVLATPRWLTTLGWAVSATWLVGTIAVVTTSGPMGGPGGPYGMAIVSLLMIWVVATSFVLGRPRRAG